MHAPSTDRHVLLIHGGLAESMDADRFWVMPGILDALTGLGFVVDAPDRDTTPSSWIAAADELARSLRWSSTVVGASNGVSVAVRLALQHPSLVRRLVLLWPATAGTREVDGLVPAAASHLLTGATLRGVDDTELAGLRLPVAVLPAEPENPGHRFSTAEGLVAILRGAVLIEPGYPDTRVRWSPRCVPRRRRAAPVDPPPNVRSRRRSPSD